MARRLSRTVSAARAALFWERLWPVLYHFLIIAGLFVALSWLGLWLVLPTWLRWLALAAFAWATLYSCRSLPFLRWPSRAEGLHRIEAQGDYHHRPLTALEDELASDADDPTARALWEAHRARALSALNRLRAGWPHPHAFRRDPWAIRALVGLLLFVGFGVAGGDRGPLIWSAVVGGSETSAVAGRIDAWVTPPAYTRRPPVFLTGEMGPARDPDATVSVPEGSVVVVRSQGGSRDLSVVLVDGETETAIEAEGGGTTEALASAPVEHRVTLQTPGIVEIRKGTSTINSWRFAVEPDADPEIRLTEDPQGQLSGTLKLAYEVEDDNGVIAARAEIAPGSKPVALQKTGKPPRPLVEAPTFPLSLPQRRARTGTAETFRDLTAHPWAGSEVRLSLVARDEAGQEGRSEVAEFTLPARSFRKPLARAIVEQRRNLALDANHQPQVIDAYDILLLAPEYFMDDTRPYLGMRFVYARLVEAEDDEALKEVLDLMWDVALSIEDGDLSMAERALRDAQEALRKALEEGASDEEIAKLTQELREALNQYMQALTEQMRQNPQAMQQMDPNAQSLRSQDLEEMLKRIEELARNGARDAARDLLAQMQRMLENLQTGRSQQMPDGESSEEMMKMLNELAEMIQRQQELMEQTFKQGQQGENQPNPGPKGQQQGQQGQQGEGQQGQQGGPMTKEQLAEILKQLKEGQGDLASRLQQMLDQMDQNGMQPSGELGRAGDAMGRARDLLGQQQPGEAVGEQGEALQALRDGAQQLGEQMLSQGSPGGLARREGRDAQDPLGRPRRHEGPDLGTQVKVPDDIDIQRARRILEELRRRFSDPTRPGFELEYLERLLKRY
ncbi:TIGR02302 family protein [Breoghania sp. L-A4]|uniref:TIGR02302 family protein n=1 Tax=Breoghania sp. L-A4 TaxID=2304600 RepID=UPI001967E9DD|nr:TIGR02302 family protein [Breoghania sp. L-A4]